MENESNRNELENSTGGEFSELDIDIAGNSHAPHNTNTSRRHFSYPADNTNIENSIKLAGRLPHGVLSHMLKSH